MEKLKQHRICRRVAAVLMPLLAVPMWLLSCFPAAAQFTPVTDSNLATVMVWPFAVSQQASVTSLAGRDPNMGYSAAQALVDFLALNTRWQVTIFQPDSPLFKQAIQAAGGASLPGGGVPPPGPPPGVGPGVPPGNGPGPGLPPVPPPPAPGNVSTPSAPSSTAIAAAGPTSPRVIAAAGPTNTTGDTGAIPVLPPAPGPGGTGAQATTGAAMPPAPGPSDVQPLPGSPLQGVNEAVAMAHLVHFHYAVLGSVDSILYSPVTHLATATLTARVYDASQPGVVQEALTGPLIAVGTSKVDPAKLGIPQAQGLALQDAAHQLGLKMIKTGMLPASYNNIQPPPKPHHAAISPWVIVALGLIGVAAAVALTGGGSGKPQFPVPVVGGTTGTPAGALAPPTKAVAVVVPTGAGGFNVQLQFQASANPSLVQTYVITRSGSGGTINFRFDASGGTTLFQTSDTSVAPGQTYSYSVQALGFNGQVSVAVPFVTPSGQTTIVAGRPSAPTNLVAQAVGGRVNLTWTPSIDASFVATYTVLRGNSPVGPFVAISPPNLTATSFTDISPDLQPGQTYYYVVQAVSSTIPAINSQNSNVAAVTIAG